MSTYKWLLDPGHGGMLNGKYTSAPSKMYRFDDGLVFYEGVNNRAIVKKLITKLEEACIDFALVSDAIFDTPLSMRVSMANLLYAQDKRCIYLSIHSDAMPPGAHGKGSGFCVFTSVGQTRSDQIAETFSVVYRRELTQFKFRVDRCDGDADKEEDFYVLKNTHCPALLVENLFFDNRREAEFLLSDTGQHQIAKTLFKSIQEIENQKPI